MNKLLKLSAALTSAAFAEVPSVSYVDNGDITVYGAQCGNTQTNLSCEENYSIGYDFTDVYFTNDSENLYVAITACNDVFENTMFEGDHFLYLDLVDGEGTPFDVRYKLDYFRRSQNSFSSALMSKEEWNGTSWVFVNETYPAADNGSVDEPFFDISNNFSQNNIGDLAEGPQLLISNYTNQGDKVAPAGSFVELKIPISNAPSVINWKLTGPVDEVTSTDGQGIIYAWRAVGNTMDIDGHSRDWISNLGFSARQVNVVGGSFANLNTTSALIYDDAYELVIADPAPAGKVFNSWDFGSADYRGYVKDFFFHLNDSYVGTTITMTAKYIDDASAVACGVGECYDNPLVINSDDEVVLSGGLKYLKINGANSSQKLRLQFANTGQDFNIVGNQCGEGFGTPENTWYFKPSAGPIGCDRVLLEPNGGVFSVIVKAAWY